MIRQQALDPPPPRVVVLAKFVLARPHLCEHLPNLGERVLHRPRFGFGDRETGEQGGLQTYAPTSSSIEVQQRFELDKGADP